MGGHLVWGSMGRLKGVVTYAISPMEQRAFAGLISKVCALRAKLLCNATSMLSTFGEADTASIASPLTATRAVLSSGARLSADSAGHIPWAFQGRPRPRVRVHMVLWKTARAPHLCVGPSCLVPHSYVAFSPSLAFLLRQGLPNVFRRVTENIPDVAPAFIFYYAVYSWASNSHANMHRKQPGATGAH